MSDLKRLLRVGEVAEVTGLSEARIYDLMRQGVLPCVRLGRQLRIDKDMLNRWIESGGQSLPGGWRRAAK